MTFPPRLSRGIFSVICSTGSKPTRGKVTSHDRGDKAELLHDATNRPSRLPYTKRGAPSSSVSQTVLTDSSSSVAGRQAGTGVSRKRVVRRLKKMPRLHLVPGSLRRLPAQNPSGLKRRKKKTSVR